MVGSDVVVDMLVEYGVRHLFGVCGDTSVRFYESLYQNRDRITHVLARDERSAAFMADAYARLTNRPGVCESPSGAGALYTVPGVAEANASSIPVVALTSGTDLASEDKGMITELDHHVLYQSITKWSYFVKRGDKIPEVMRRAFRVATSGRPGAVHLAFPSEIMRGEVGDGCRDIYAEPDCRQFPAHRAPAEEASIEQAAALLATADRPVLVAGGGVLSARAWDELRAVAELLAAPVGTTVTGKGAMADTHPLCIGIVGDNGYRDYANAIVADADVLLYVGCKLGSVTTIKWTLPRPTAAPKLIHLDVDPQLIGLNYPTDVGLVGDARAVLSDLAAALRRRLPAGGNHQGAATVDRIAAAKAAWWEAVRPYAESDEMPVRPERSMAALRRVLPDDAVIVADAGTPTPYLCAHYDLRAAGRNVVVPRAYGGLGYALPAAVGAKVARPDSVVVGLMGDGSFAMSAGELETLARLDLPVVLVVFTNATFGWIKVAQRFGSGNYFGVDFSPLDHGAIARAFGLRGVRVENAGDLEDVLEEAIASGKPTLIDVPTESEEKLVPPVLTWREAERREATTPTVP